MQRVLLGALLAVLAMAVWPDCGPQDWCAEVDSFCKSPLGRAQSRERELCVVLFMHGTQAECLDDYDMLTERYR